jgi:3-phosphoshikimate 1-carboxyvinyltransferase
MSAPESSQFVSALLMVAPYAANDVFVALDGPLPSEPYVDMTIAVMHTLGVEVLAAENRRFVVAAGQRYQAGDFEIEADASAATYLWAAAAVTGGAVRVLGLDRGSLQGDVGFVDVLAQMGCTVHDEPGSQTGSLPHAIGDLPNAIGGSPHALEVQGPPPGGLRGIEIDLNAMPDTVQTLAVVGLFASGPTDIRNVANLRIKETDRIAALAVELARLGARVEVRPDGLTIHPPAAIQPAEIETYDDHRMALSFAVAGLAAEGIVIRNAGCVSKSYPEYFEVLNQLA